MLLSEARLIPSVLTFIYLYEAKLLLGCSIFSKRCLFSLGSQLATVRKIAIGIFFAMFSSNDMTKFKLCSSITRLIYAK